MRGKCYYCCSFASQSVETDPCNRRSRTAASQASELTSGIIMIRRWNVAERERVRKRGAKFTQHVAAAHARHATPRL
eukprot:2174876-Rhodomonas_salina.1